MGLCLAKKRNPLGGKTPGVGVQPALVKGIGDKMAEKMTTEIHISDKMSTQARLMRGYPVFEPSGI